MKISVRQICFIMFAYTAATKLLLFPTVLSLDCGRDLLLPALINFVICGIVVWSLSYLSSRTEKTFFQLLEGTFGNVFARIIYALFAVMFMFAAVLPVFEQKQYVHAIFYDTTPSFTVFLPFFVFSVYAASKKFTNIGRCADICMPIFTVCIFAIFAMSFLEVEGGNLMPMFRTPANRIFGSSLGTAYSFVEPCWLLMFMGHYKYKKGDAAKITFSYAGGAVAVLLFLAVFYGIYGAITPSRTFAVARISLFFPAIETMGRIDLILLLVMEIVMLFAVVLNIQLAVHCIASVIGVSGYGPVSLAVNLAIGAVVVFTSNMYQDVYTVYFKWLWIMFIAFAVAFPLLAWTLKRRRE